VGDALTRRTVSGFANYVTGLLTAAKRPPVQSFSLYSVLADLENRLQNPGNAAPVAAAKAQLFGCLRNRLDVTESKALTSKLLNLCLAKQHFRARDAILRSRPLSVVVDPSNSCNLACPGCVHSARAKESKWFDWKPGILSAPRMMALLDRYGPTALFVTFYNYGEPLVNPETPKFIRYSKSYLLRTLISTNLSLPRFDPQAYVESGLDYMILSIDGATQPVYERFRRKGNLEQVFQNVRKLVQAKRESGRSTPVITWRFLAFEHNVHEIPAAIEMARQLRVDQFEASSAWDVSWDDPDIRAAPLETVKVEFGLDVYTAMAQNWNPFPQSLNVAAIDREFDAEIEPGAESGASQSASTCEWLYKTIAMDAGGRIFPCCCSPGQHADLTFANFEAGVGVDTNGHAEMFNSGMHQLARRFFGNPQLYWPEHGEGHAGRHPYCVKCEFNKIAFPHRMQMRNYFAMAAPAAFDSQSLDLLSTW
jgi:MoaA/NifB/PqqE/SkfB family radical SAM enzyme